MVGTEATTESRFSKVQTEAKGLAIAAARWLRCRPVSSALPRPVRFAVTLTLILMVVGRCAAQEVSPDPIAVSGDTIYRWQIGTADASLLVGKCVIEQSGRRVTADSILLVVDGDVGQVRNRLVIEGMRDDGGRKSQRPQAMTIETLDEPKILSPNYRGKPKESPQLLKYLPDSGGKLTTSLAEVRPVQFQQPIESTPGFVPSDPVPIPVAPGIAPGTPGFVPGASGIVPGDPGFMPAERGIVPGELESPPPITLSDGATTGGFTFSVAGGTRSIEILARGTSMPPVLENSNRPESNETVVIARGGVTVLVRDVTAQLPSGESIELGTISLSADRVVGWLPLLSGFLTGDTDFSQAQGELYLEGDIVFRQGERIIYAESMYYNIAEERGIVLDAEAITTIPEYQGVVRLKADVMQQIAKGNFIAFDAAVTSSRMGVPRYWLQSQQLRLTDREKLITDPVTGLPVIDREPFVNSSNNFVYFGGVPLLYWPTFSTSLERPAYYLSGIKVKNDDMFGTQIFLDFDLFQLFGIENAPRGVSWDLSTDYLSERGFALGTTLDYTVDSIHGIAGPIDGYLDAWVIDDSGTDTLGRDRRNLPPEKSVRGRGLLRHRHYLRNDYEFIAEIGWISDRNFLEQYLENEWDRDVDHRTAMRLRKYYYSNLFDLSAKVQVNDFFTEDEQLPMLEHYLIGGSLLHDRLTYSAHSKVGYQRLNVADTPINPAEAALESPVPGEANAEGLVAATRQEIAMPMSLGPVRVVPSISGEAARYGEAADGESLTRLTGQAGIRASLQMLKVDPCIQSSLLNVRGLAHKLEWSAEYFYADSDTNLDELPLYDALDDNAQEQFRRRFITGTFGGVLPDQFDPRTYALRHGLQGLVASPSDVIADDLQQFRIGLNQRFQTKRGLPGRSRIVDLLEVDLNLLLFPKSDRDNFGETLGPATYDVRYNIGDRVTLLSDGYIDFFDNGLRSISAGFRTSRPGLGDAYIGLLSLEGPISSTVLRSTLDYRMNEKWIVSAGTTYDFGSIGNVGQSLALTRIGESLLLRLGINIDEGRDNTSVGFLIEPRFWPSKRRGSLGGQLIPPPGVEGLE